MTNKGKLYYKTCRENAGLTQEDACKFLNIAEATTLSKYENGHLKVDDGLANRMALLYRNKLLPVVHLRHIHPELSEFIPDPRELNSDGEQLMYLELAADHLSAVFRKAKKYLADDGKLDEEEISKLKKKIPELKTAVNEVMGFIGYIESQSLKMEQKDPP